MPSAPAPQHLFTTVLARVRGSCAFVLGAQMDLARIVVEPPRDASHGDMATNAAMVLAKDAGKKPRELAEAIAERLRADDKIAEVDVAGPGFINLTLKAHVWGEELRVVLEAGADYGRSAMGAGDKVNVEYVSANPTGPMHVGHCRRAWAETQDHAGSRMAAAGARQGHRHDDGHDPRRSRRAQCPPRRVLFRALADRGRGRSGRRHHRVVARQRRGL